MISRSWPGWDLVGVEIDVNIFDVVPSTSHGSSNCGNPTYQPIKSVVCPEHQLDGVAMRSGTHLAVVAHRRNAVSLPIGTPSRQLISRHGAAQRKFVAVHVVVAVGNVSHSVLCVFGELAQVITVAVAVVHARHTRCRGRRRLCFTVPAACIIRVGSAIIINHAPATTETRA
jgi:hypothetical protein